jgi:hypothetical protein
MKLLFDSLDALLAELGERRVEAVRVSRLVNVESGQPTAGIPHLTSRILVTAAIQDGFWAEYRHWIGRSIAEIGERGFYLPPRLEERTATALTQITERVAAAGFQVRDGIYTHDRGTLDSFRL